MILAEEVMRWADGTPVTKTEVIVATIIIIATILLLGKVLPRKRK